MLSLGLKRKVVETNETARRPYRGSNFLHSKSYYSPQQDFERPDYWVDEWNSSELTVETTAPIRIVSETVTHKKVKYVRK